MTAETNAPDMSLATQPARSGTTREEMAKLHPSTGQEDALAAVYDLLRAIGRQHLTNEHKPRQAA